MRTDKVAKQFKCSCGRILPSAYAMKQHVSFVCKEAFPVYYVEPVEVRQTAE